jgi:hypothetical protein
MKDMNSKTDMYRANAIRVLCRIIDSTLLTQIERYLKQAIVDKNPVVASAALVSGIYLLQVCPVLHLDILLLVCGSFSSFLLCFPHVCTIGRQVRKL